MPYYVLSYRIIPYIDILSRNTHNRYINTYIHIIGILAQANVDERCGSLRHSWLVCHTPYLKMFLQHSYQYLWRVMKSSCTWSKLQKIYLFYVVSVKYSYWIFDHLSGGKGAKSTYIRPSLANYRLRNFKKLMPLGGSVSQKWLMVKPAYFSSFAYQNSKSVATFAWSWH